MSDFLETHEGMEAVRQWTRVQPIVSAFLGSLVRNQADRDDLLQETAVAVVQSYAAFDRTRSFENWVMGIAQNQLRNYFRKLARGRLVFDSELVSRLADSFVRTGPETQEKLEQLEDCFGKLPPAAQELCRKRYREELTLNAIAAHAGRSLESITKSLQRIREQLRACIERSQLGGGRI
ncbi:MAG: sigma-70 family RNA polymerase sigma factor [Planctomycetota bacterium]